MAEERIVERPTTTIVERRGSGMGVIVAIVFIAMVVLVAVFLISQNNREDARSDAITGAAQSVGQAADKVGDAAGKAVDKMN